MAMIPARGENYELKLWKRKENSAYEWEEAPALIFYGRPASKIERKKYRIQKGVLGATDSTYVVCTNLPETIKEGDRIDFLGKEWKVESVGYFFDENLIVNPRIMSDEYIAKRCPKGMTLQ